MPMNKHKTQHKNSDLKEFGKTHIPVQRKCCSSKQANDTQRLVKVGKRINCLSTSSLYWKNSHYKIDTEIKSG